MQFSPLQSRLVASLVASCLLILLYLFLFSPNFALAAELREPLPVVFDDYDLPAGPVPHSRRDAMYEPDFSPFGRSIIGRAPEIVSLTDDKPMPMNLGQGITQHFMLALAGVSSREAGEGRPELRNNHNVSERRSAGAGAGPVKNEEVREQEDQELARRQGSRRIYISANTCQQPRPLDASQTTPDPPQLTLYVSKSADNQEPGPLADAGTQDVVVFTEGAATYNFTTDREVYLGVHATDVSDNFSGIYNFEIAVSTVGYYYEYNEQDDADLIWVDSDSQGALLMTHNLTDSVDPVVQQKVMSTEPYVLFAHNKEDPAINGLRHSYCGLLINAQIAAAGDRRQTGTVRSGMTKRGPGNLPKQQFFFSGLNASSEYIGILAKEDWEGGDVGKRQEDNERGRQVFRATSFSTKSNHGNCALVIDLDFCDQIAYSVPSNPNFGNSSQLAQFYDSYASHMYSNFNKSLSQIACEAPSSQRYSLARNCTDCAAAYKDWLCLVTIPRCEDFSSTAPYLQPRAVNQPFPDGTTLDAAALAQAGVQNATSFSSSRNPRIDEMIKPGPYKELLPCDDLCYKLVQSCPAALGFGCPLPGGVGFQGNYANHDPRGGLTCNFPGSAHFKSGSGRAVVHWGLVVGLTVVGLLVV